VIFYTSVLGNGLVCANSDILNKIAAVIDGRRLGNYMTGKIEGMTNVDDR